MENIAGNIYHRELQLVKNGVEEGKDIINILGETWTRFFDLASFSKCFNSSFFIIEQREEENDG